VAFLAVWDGFDWWNLFHLLGAFDADLEHFMDVSKSVTNALKRSDYVGIPRTAVVEAQTLGGYRNPPFPGFDIKKDGQRLANGGSHHGGIFGGEQMFSHVLETVVTAPELHIPYQSFKDFVVSGEWATSGSSSVGEVEWEAFGEKGKFKARKNLVPDVVNLETLYDQTLQFGARQVNQTLIKSELGKLRLAVASDIHTYLKMSWLAKLAGSFYKYWPGSTIEENLSEQTKRMIEMLDVIIDSWNLPFDFFEFDHQPSTTELQILTAELIRRARLNVPLSDRAFFDSLAGSVYVGFQHSKLRVRLEKGGILVLEVKGGVMSGLRLTSYLGNGWNTVLTKWVGRILEMAGVSHKSKDWVRGDDTQISTPTYAQCLLYKIGYDALGAKGAESKFGIHSRQSEFLRTWFNQDGCRGYLCRAIPALTQRKPWSSIPWSDEAVMNSLWQAGQTLLRRGVANERWQHLWGAYKRVWSQRKHVTQTWLQIPLSMGGLGVEPWDGKTRLNGVWPGIDKRSITITNMTQFREKQVTQILRPIVPDLTQQEAASIAQQLVSEKVVMDDVPAVNSLLRKQVKPPPRVSSTTRQPDWSIPGYTTIAAAGRTLAASRDEQAHHLPYHPGLYGKYSARLTEWDLLTRIRRERGETTSKVIDMDRAVPGFRSDVLVLEQRGLQRSEAIDWLFGSTTFNVSGILHPALSKIVAKECVNVLNRFLGRLSIRRRGGWRAFSAQVYSHLESCMYSSPLSTRIYRW
jgi:hypothetical protein